jgi:hypothetical protein
VATSVERIEALQGDEWTARIASGAARKLAAKAALQQWLVNIAATVRVLAEASPGLDAHFQLPENTTDLRLLTVSRQFAQQAAPLERQLCDHGMPLTVLADLQAAIDAFDDALRHRGMSRDQRVSARSTTQTVLSNALAAVRKLDVIVANHTSLDPVARQLWTHVRRIGHPGRKADARKAGAAVLSVVPRPQARVNQAAVT